MFLPAPRWPPLFSAAALSMCPLMLLHCRFDAAYAVVAAGYVLDAVAIVDAVRVCDAAVCSGGTCCWFPPGRRRQHGGHSFDLLLIFYFVHGFME